VRTSPLDFLPELGTLDEILKLVRLANDKHTTVDERRAAALKACERIHRTGLIEKLEALKRWAIDNGTALKRAHSVASFLDTFRGR
jgi:hypothetical protein